MILVKIQENNEEKWGLLEDGTVHLLAAPPYESIEKNGETRDAGQVRFLAPCDPTNIVAVGKNYADHIAEFDSEMPSNPTLFLKPITALNHPDADIVLPPRGLSSRIDYEGELALVIKKKARNVQAGDAAEYILGYTCLNDVTARDLQRQDGQWTRGKGFDGFAPVGPVLVDTIDPDNTRIRTRLNGKVVQESNTSMMLWKVSHLVAFISAFMTLLPGDVVTTGTPEGVGAMRDGDVVEIEVDGIGILRNKAVQTPE